MASGTCTGTGSSRDEICIHCYLEGMIVMEREDGRVGGGIWWREEDGELERRAGD